LKHRQGERHVRIQAETGVMLLQANRCQRLPPKPQKLAETVEQILPHGPQEEPTLTTPHFDLDLQPPELFQFKDKRTSRDGLNSIMMGLAEGGMDEALSVTSALVRHTFTFQGTPTKKADIQLACSLSSVFLTTETVFITRRSTNQRSKQTNKTKNGQRSGR